MKNNKNNKNNKNKKVLTEVFFIDKNYDIITYNDYYKNNKNKNFNKNYYLENFILVQYCKYINKKIK